MRSRSTHAPPEYEIGVVMTMEETDCFEPLTDRQGEIWFREKYDMIAAAPSGYAFISLKFKRFDTINWVLGREVGDQVIRQTYHIMCNWLRPREYAVHLYAGCFCLLARFSSVEDIDTRIPELIIAIREMPGLSVTGHVFVSAGIYQLPEEPVDFYMAQHYADLCRRESNLIRYRNSCYEIYNVTYHDTKEHYLDLDENVMSAIRHGDFKLYLQPKVNLETGEVEGAEALVRWQDPKRGLIPPGDFIPGLEESGLIRQVDLYLFDQVCQKLHFWRHTLGKNCKISVNLSKAYFQDPYFLGEYTEVFERYEIPKECIEIELVESIVLNQSAQVNKVVKQLNEYGFTCSLDDFGSGFSSYDVLANTNLSGVKIDRSLFRNPHNQKERLVIKHIFATVKDLGLTTIAEGVETKEYVDFLYGLGCDYIQGYIFYKPMPADEFESRFIRGGERAALPPG